MRNIKTMPDKISCMVGGGSRTTRPRNADTEARRIRVHITTTHYENRLHLPTCVNISEHFCKLEFQKSLDRLPKLARV